MAYHAEELAAAPNGRIEHGSDPMWIEVPPAELTGTRVAADVGDGEVAWKPLVGVPPRWVLSPDRMHYDGTSTFARSRTWCGSPGPNRARPPGS